MQNIAEKKIVPENKKSVHDASKKAIGRAALGLSVIAVFSKIFGFSEKVIIAHYFGTDARADVYFASMGIVLSFVFLVKELIYPSVLPVFAQTLKVSFCASSDLFKKIFFRLLVIFAVFALIIVLFSDVITSIIVPGFSEDKKLLTSSLLRFLAPVCFFMCLMTFTQSILNCRKNFFKSAIPEAGIKIFVVLGLLILIPVMDIYALAITALIGSILAFIIQFGFIPESKAIFTNSICKVNNELARILKLMGPLSLGVVFSHINGLVDNILASTLPTGQLSFLGYSKKLTDAILLIGPIALITVVYSQLSHLNAEEKLDEFKALFIKAFRLILFVSIPISIVLIILREPIVAALFERGRFTQVSTHGTSQSLFIYAIGLVTFAVEALVVYSFYALSNTKIPVKIGILGVLLDITLAVWLVKPFGFAAIAWAYVISKTVKVFILLLVMDRKFRFLRKVEFINFIVKITVSCLISTLCLYLFKDFNSNNSFLQMLVFDIFVPVGGFAVAFLICCRQLKIKELNLLLAIIFRKKSLDLEFVGNRS